AAESDSRKLASLQGSPNARRSIATSAGASAGTPCRIRKGTSVRPLPAGLRFRRAAILGLPEIEMRYAPGCAGALQQIQQPGRARKTLRTAHDLAPGPRGEPRERLGGCITHDPVRAQRLGNEALRVPDRRREQHLRGIGAE